MDDASAILTIKKVQLDDENHYTVSARNAYGEVEETVSLVVISMSFIAIQCARDILIFVLIIEPPSSPGKPESADVSSDSLTVYWKAPSDDGHAEILEYRLEYRTAESQQYVL